MSSSRDFLVRRTNLRQTRFASGCDSSDAMLDRGEIMLRVDSFAFTANNVSYAMLGDSLDYWKFFPGPEGWGRIPVWGFADVLRSRHNEIRPNERIYGYYPMSTHLRLSVDHVSSSSFVEASSHRAGLTPIYNRYTRLSGDPAYVRANEGYVAVLRPLFLGAFLLADFLVDHSFFGAQSVIISSASCKTALGLGFLISDGHASQCETIGLTSRARAAFVGRTGYFQRTLSYDEIPRLDVEPTSLFVDFAGDTEIARSVHRRLGDRLRHSASVGVTHWEHGAPPSALPGPGPTPFSASHWATKRLLDWGAPGFQMRTAGALERFMSSAGSWLEIVEEHGEAAIEACYRATLNGELDPAVARVLSFESATQSAVKR